MTRRPIIAGNWKMNGTWASTVRLAQSISDLYIKDYDGVEVVICPPFPYIKAAANVFAFDRSNLKVGAQNVYELMPEGNAAATSEISVEMVKDLECAYCIVGHSECREHDSESDERIAEKIKLLLSREIVPIVCCGEGLEVNEAGGTVDFVKAQINKDLDGLTSDQAAGIVIAYEPIWAIGTGNVPIPEKVDEVCAEIRGVIESMYDTQAAQDIRILYGGSLKPANAHQFLPLENVDGGLIGGASLDKDSFFELIKATKEFKCL